MLYLSFRASQVYNI